MEASTVLSNNALLIGLFCLVRIIDLYRRSYRRTKLLIIFYFCMFRRHYFPFLGQFGVLYRGLGIGKTCQMSYYMAIYMLACQQDNPNRQGAWMLFLAEKC